MDTQVDQHNTQPNKNTGMYPTNSQVGGPGALGSGPAQNSGESRFENTNVNTQGGYSGQQEPHHQAPPPIHPDRAGRKDQYVQDQGQTVPGNGVGQDQYDQYGSQQPGERVTDGKHHHGGAARTAEAGAVYEGEKLAHGGQTNNQYAPGTGTGTGTGQNDQYANENQPHTLDRRGHRGPGGAVRAAEAGAAYEGGKHAHNGHHVGADGTDGHYQQGTGTGPGQHDHHANQNQGVIGTGHHTGGPARAAEAGAAYEGGKLAHGGGSRVQHGGHLTGHHNDLGTNAPGYGAGPGTATTGTGAGVGQPTGQFGTGTGAGTTAGTGGAIGATQPGVGHGIGQGAGTYTGQKTTGAGLGTTGVRTGTGPMGSGPGTSGTGSGQAHVILGKLQQAGGALLGNDAMKSKGLEREAKGVAHVDQQEAQRLEGMANARREKAGGVLSGGGPASANAGVDPTVGTHGRNL